MRSRGFSIVEIMFSIALLAMTSVMAVNLFSYMSKISSKGSEMSVGNVICSRLVNDMTRNEGSDLNKMMMEHQASGFSTCGNEVLADRTYFYIVEAVPVKRSGDANSGLVSARAVVFWFTKGAPFSAGDFRKEMLESSSIDEFLKSAGAKFNRSESGFSYARLSRIVSIDKG